MPEFSGPQCGHHITVKVKLSKTPTVTLFEDVTVCLYLIIITGENVVYQLTSDLAVIALLARRVA